MFFGFFFFLPASTAKAIITGYLLIRTDLIISATKAKGGIGISFGVYDNKKLWILQLLRKQNSIGNPSMPAKGSSTLQQFRQKNNKEKWLNWVFELLKACSELWRECEWCWKLDSVFLNLRQKASNWKRVHRRKWWLLSRRWQWRNGQTLLRIKEICSKARSKHGLQLTRSWGYTRDRLKKVSHRYY